MLTFRPMTTNDIELGMRLKQQAGWNQVEADWQRFLAMSPGCFVAEWDHRPAGTAVAVTLDRVGWVAMILVDKAFRGSGIGTGLVQHAIDYLKQLQVPTIRLDATALGQPIYQRLGFVAEYELARWEGVAVSRPKNPGIRPPTADELAQVIQLDQEVTGTERSRLLQCLDLRQAVAAFGVDGRIRGYMTYRVGSNAAQIGPGVALDAEAGQSVADAIATALAGQRVFMDIPLENAAASDWAGRQGWSVQRKFLRMRLGEPVADTASLLWASSGPETG